MLGVRPEEVIFTSGATESNNLALLGLVDYGLESGRRHVLSMAIEHKAVLEPLERMVRLGFEVELAPVTPGGYVEPETIRRLLRPDTLVVLRDACQQRDGRVAANRGNRPDSRWQRGILPYRCRATFGKEVASLRRVQWDFVSISGHKIYGPKASAAVRAAAP